MEMVNSKKTYKAPKAKVVKVKVQGVLCSSLDSTFGLSDSDVEKGDDSVWGKDLDW